MFWLQVNGNWIAYATMIIVWQLANTRQVIHTGLNSARGRISAPTASTTNMPPDNHNEALQASGRRIPASHTPRKANS